MAELYSRLLDRFYEFILSRAWNKDVIRSYANLRKREEFSVAGEYCGAFALYLAGIQGFTK